MAALSVPFALVVAGGLLAAVGIVLWFVFGPAPKAVETYGHPEDPLEAVKRRLPKAPIGFLWELSIERDRDSGHPMLKLALLDTATFKPVADRSVDLEWNHKMGMSWRADYERYSIVRSTFRNDLLIPMADWARREAAKRDPRSGLERHEIIT